MNDLVEFINSATVDVKMRRPDGYGITAREYAATDPFRFRNPEQAKQVLDQLVEADVLKIEMMVFGGHNTSVYTKK